MNAPAKLSELPAGASAIIEELANGISALTRLRELGLVPGTKVKLVRRAPLGEPIEIALRGSRIAMRNKDAEAIAISPLIWK
jgi:Fe2+ transport system protein FeoA